MHLLPNLRSSLRAIVLASLPIALTLQSGATTAAGDPVEVSVLIQADAFSESLSACLEDDLACETLCREVLLHHGLLAADDIPTFSRCEVRPEADLYDVNMEYVVGYETAMGCGVAQVTPVPGQDPLATHFAAVTSMETESVFSFVRLARELRFYGAPSNLVERTMAAARDEIRHAVMSHELASRLGAQRVAPSLPSLSIRQIAVVGLEHVVSSCVQETFSALIATWQARSARDPEVRKLMAMISNDELGHAELADDVRVWLGGQLTAAERRRIDIAARQAAEELASELRDPPARVIEDAGHPSANDARILLAAMVEHQSLADPLS